MIQEIITYTIIAVAIGLACFRFYKVIERLLVHPAEKRSESKKCGGCATECSLKDLPTARDCETSGNRNSLVLH